jgi:hypothetical protein
LGIPTTDERNRGARKTPQRFSVSGGLNGSRSDPESTPVEFVLLKNCYVDKRLGAVVKRGGSAIETINGPIGIPLGIAEHIVGANDALIPTRRSLLANFGGTQWRQAVAGIWSTVTLDSGVTTSTARPSTFTQLGDQLYIAAGTPAYWAGPGTAVKRIGIIPPSAPVTITSYNTGTGITLTAGTSYVITYYNSTTGLESDWSEPSALVPAITNQSIVIAIPAASSTDWDQIRIYRYLDGGAVPYLVATVAAGTTSYADTKPDSQLTARAAARYSRAIPSAQSYVCANYAQHLWFVDAADPYRLIFSQPYTGSNNDPQYFPDDQDVRTSDPITGLLVTSSRMLVFHPRSISIITGTNKDEFDLKQLVPGIGTVFAQSIATNGTDIVFLSEQGFVSITFGSGNRIHLSREIDLDLQPLLAGSYNSSIYASSCWNPGILQFVFSISAISTADAQWQEIGTGSTATAVAGWETTPGGVTDTWEDVSSVTASAQTRVMVWGWSPELSSPQANLWMEYEFPVAADENATGAFISCMVHPSPSSDLNDPQQDKTYMGYYSGTSGAVLATFGKSRNLDTNGADIAITSELITGRIVPGLQDGGYKMFQELGFTGTYSDPTSDSLGVLTYLLDYEDPHLRSYLSNLKNFTSESSGHDLKKFSTTEGRYVHLRLVDTSLTQSKVLLSDFYVHYRERNRKGGR